MDFARFLAKPVTREKGRAPAAMDDTLRGDGGIPAPIRMVRVCYGLQSHIRNVSISTPRNCPTAPDRNISVARRMIGAYFQLWTGIIARPVSLARLRARSSSTGSDRSGFSQRTFHRFWSAASIGSPVHRGGARQISTKSISAPAAVPRSWIVATPGNNSRTSRRRSSVRSAHGERLISCIFRRPASGHDGPPHRSRLSHLSTRLYSASRASSARTTMARAEFAVLGAENSNSRGVTHHDQGLGETNA